MSVVRCPECGRNTFALEDACRNCGAALSDDEGLRVSWRRSAALVSVVVLAVIAACLSVLGFLTDGNEDGRETAALAPAPATDCATAPSCLDEAVRRLHTAQSSDDQATAAALLAKSCPPSGPFEPEGCHRLGTLYQEGIGVDRDDERGFRLLVRACDAGDARACSGVAYSFDQGRGTAPDARESRRYRERACELEGAEECDALGAMLMEARGGERDVTRAEVLLRSGCEAGRNTACALLGTLLAAFPARREEALPLLRSGCEQHLEFACSALRSLDAGPARSVKMFELINSQGVATGLKVRAVVQPGGAERFHAGDCVLESRTMRMYQLGTGAAAPCYKPVPAFMARYAKADCSGEVYLEWLFPFALYEGAVFFAPEDFRGEEFAKTALTTDLSPAYLRLPDGRCVEAGSAVVRRFAPAPRSWLHLPTPPYTVRRSLNE